MKLLVSVAHPHYAGTFLAGTLYRHTQRGDEVTVVSHTHGELMTNRYTPDELREVNRAEALASAAIIGIEDFRILDHADTYLENTLANREEMAEVIREVQPDTILTHWPTDSHRDFRVTAEVTMDAAFAALFVTGAWAARQPSHWTGRAFGFEHPGLSVDFRATHLIDISDVMDVKVASLDCFATHAAANFAGDLEAFRSAHTGPARYWGAEACVPYVEAFGQLKLHERHTKANLYLP